MQIRIFLQCLAYILTSLTRTTREQLKRTFLYLVSPLSLKSSCHWQAAGYRAKGTRLLHTMATSSSGRTGPSFIARLFPIRAIRAVPNASQALLLAVTPPLPKKKTIQRKPILRSARGSYTLPLSPEDGSRGQATLKDPSPRLGSDPAELPAVSRLEHPLATRPPHHHPPPPRPELPPAAARGKGGGGGGSARWGPRRGREGVLHRLGLRKEHHFPTFLRKDWDFKGWERLTYRSAGLPLENKMYLFRQAMVKCVVCDLANIQQGPCEFVR